MKNLHTPVEKIPSPGKEYICSQKYGKIDHDAKCTKSSFLTKVIDTIIEIYLFEHQCVILKGLL